MDITYWKIIAYIFQSAGFFFIGMAVGGLIDIIKNMKDEREVSDETDN